MSAGTPGQATHLHLKRVRGTPLSDRDDLPTDQTDDEWRRTLTSEQYRVLRQHGTERAGTSPLTEEHRSGVFRCAGCGEPLVLLRDEI